VYIGNNMGLAKKSIRRKQSLRTISEPDKGIKTTTHSPSSFTTHSIQLLFKQLSSFLRILKFIALR